MYVSICTLYVHTYISMYAFSATFTIIALFCMDHWGPGVIISKGKDTNGKDYAMNKGCPNEDKFVATFIFQKGGPHMSTELVSNVSTV